MDISAEKFQQIKSSLEEKGAIEARTVGSSMEPLIREGQKIRIRRMAPEALRVGDPVVFLKAGRLVCHIVIRKFKIYPHNKFLVVTQGINEAFEDGEVGSDELLGVPEGVKLSALSLMFFFVKKKLREALRPRSF